MESEILLTLGFNIKHVSTHWHIEHIVELFGFSSEIKSISEYLLDLTLIEYKFCFIKPSVLASAIISFVAKHKKIHMNPGQLILTFKLSEEELNNALKEISVIFVVRSHKYF